MVLFALYTSIEAKSLVVGKCEGCRTYKLCIIHFVLICVTMAHDTYVSMVVHTQLSLNFKLPRFDLNSTWSI